MAKTACRDHADLAYDRLRSALAWWTSQSLIDGPAVRNLILDLMADLRPITTPREDA